ncbi:MAG: hypothetical protein LUD77_06645 [Clostridiales bacterium]|nr:hypothetical protein [Clostridiales bacterium]
MNETNDILNNDEVIETTVEAVTKTDCNKTFKTAATAGLVIFGGIVIYKFIAKPAIAKFKNRKKKSAEEAEVAMVDDEIVDETEEDDKEESEK